MRRLSLLLLATLLTLPLAARDYDALVVCEDRSCYMDNGRSDRMDRFMDRYRTFAYMEKDGAAWLITDSAVLAKMQSIIQPQIELGRKQAALGGEQAKLGAEQARLGAQQATIGAQQAALALDRDADDRRDALERRQRDLGRKQAVLGEQQAELGRRQAALGKQQEKASAAARTKLASLFDDAVKNGTAKRVTF